MLQKGKHNIKMKNSPNGLNRPNTAAEGEGVNRHKDGLVKHIETEKLKEHSKPTGRCKK